MKKINTFFKISNDIIKQMDENLLKKFIFLYAITSHYFLKLFHFNYNPFPKVKINVAGCLFQTRKNTIDFWMLWKDYEKDTFDQLFNEFKENDTFIDVGANIGRYSILVAKKGGIVYSFEPLKSNLNSLYNNIKLNDLGNKIKVYEIGLGDKKRKAQISYLPFKHGEALLVLDTKGKKELVNIDLLDNLKIVPQRNCFLKIDVEGFEYEVLKGAKNFIKKYKPRIIIEIWNKKTDPFLKNLGYVKKGELWYHSNEKTK